MGSLRKIYSHPSFFCPHPLGSDRILTTMSVSLFEPTGVPCYSINIRNTENTVYSNNTLLGFDTDQSPQGTASGVFLTFTTYVNSLSKSKSRKNYLDLLSHLSPHFCAHPFGFGQKLGVSYYNIILFYREAYNHILSYSLSRSEY